MPKVNEDRKKKLEDSSSSDSGPDDRTPVAKKPKTDASTSNKGKKGDEEPSWELGKKKFAKVRQFKGQIYVDIREYYGDDSDLKPGKKGISLAVDQWRKLKAAISEIDDAVSNI
ncbi:RNA polymerase II transcriptional coactivator [Folsomia candida]|uniref:Putative RNA polymerase II transcriptional coactivator n=1 Tax=Folsomia candida TaxID=158441 RepID=A0A226EW24_FOLCA|nr:RNA polymerase II transcriptional coactivator [Folsomia candida]OXA61719.1 putative RNA polymerase II transcriptional coactivator [Folsomia candida]